MNKSRTASIHEQHDDGSSCTVFVPVVVTYRTQKDIPSSTSAAHVLKLRCVRCKRIR